MLLNENLFETLNMTKDEYLRDAAEMDWESGHPYDPDDFSYFKKVCKEDGYNVNEEDFQKYWEYFDECRANQFADEDDTDDADLGDWEEMESKQVEDSDGFMTDYTWYVKDNEDGSETHVMIFGDQNLYTPMNSEPDAEFDGEEVAREWFDNYKGFAEDLDEDYHKDSFGQSNWYENVDDVMHDYEKGWLTKSRAMQICDEEGWEFYDDLDEAVNNADKDYVIEYYDNVPAAERRPSTIDDVENYYKEQVVAFPDDFSACVYALAIHDEADYEFNQQDYLEEFGYADELKTTADVITKLDDLDWGDGSIIICKITQGDRVIYDSGLSKESLLKDIEDDTLDESIDNDEVYNGYVVRKSDTSDNYFVYDNNGHVEDDDHKGQGYETKEAAIERANSLEKGIARSNSDLEEAIKPNIESEELKALAKKHNINILDAMSNGDLRMEGAGADLMKFYQEAEKLGLWQVNPELYEAKITMSKAEMQRLDKEVEEATKDVAQYNIKLKKRSDGSVEPDFSDLPEGKNIDDAKKAYDRYVKANAARPDRAKNEIIYDESLDEELDLSNVPTKELKFFAKDIHDHFNGKYDIDVIDGFKIHIKDIKNDLSREISKAKSIVDNNMEIDVEKISDGSYVYMLKKKGTKQIKEEVNEALYGTDELNQFIEVSRDLGFIGPAQMKHILDAGRKQGKSELETLLWVKETFDGKLPDSLIDGLTDEFLEIAKEIGITDQHSYEQFVANEVEPGETYTQAIKRYKQELLDAGVDLSKLTEGKLDEIAVLNVDEPAIFDAIANAKAYIHEKKYSQAIDSLNYAANLLVEPMNESAMSNLDIEIKEAGGKKNWKEKARQELADMIENLEYLKTYAPKEVNAGGNYDSIADLQADIEDLEKAINDLNAKLDYVDSIKTIGGDQE